MARTQRITVADRPDTYTVLGEDLLPIAPAEEYLQFLRDDEASPNTVKSYAAGLAAWWTLLEHTGTDRDEISTALFGQFLAYLRTGDLPGAARIGAPPVWRGPASSQLRAAAVLACYRYHADAHGLTGPYQRLFTSRGKRGRSRYVPLLAGVGPPAAPKDRPIYTVRRGNRAATPVLLPTQVAAILDGCSTQTGHQWSGPPSGLRDRLLFATLAETGMRLGEAMSLRHHDFHIGAGSTPYIDVIARQDHPRGARGKVLQARRIYIGDDLEALYSSYVWHLVDHGADLAVPDLDTAALWSPINAPKHRRRQRDLTWYSTADLQRMLAYLDVLAADRNRTVALTRPDGTLTLLRGLGDPQAARIWLLQALTGRRASEILMLDHNPLKAIPGYDRPASAEPDNGAFVARRRYQQTKVDGIVPTILVEQAIVDIITEQQNWLAAQYPGLHPRYLFLGIKNAHRGQRPRGYGTYRFSLDKLDGCHDLTDSAGRALRFTQTHRLRHTRATELLNDGVPFHVVQRYLGHKSPEMTARYAATLDATAEAEFLKHKKIGAHGADIDITPRDIYEMTQLAQRTDRILPNGVCLLPPLKSCDKGNACLSCGHFATDATHLAELHQQLADAEALITARRDQYRQRSGRELGEDNIWIIERRREITSLHAIIDRLTAEQADATIAGAGTAKRLPLLQIQTRGAHRSALDKAHPPPDTGEQ